MLIKLLAGGCGYEKKMPDGSIIRGLKTPADGAFDCPEPTALRMIESGQAQALEPKPEVDSSQTASRFSSLTLKELKRLADKAGLSYPARVTKADLIEALEDEDV